MNPEFAVDLFKQVVTMAVLVISPFLVVMVLVGLSAGLIQAVTSIQEQTLTFAPKVFALGGLLLLLSPWLMRTMIDFTTTLLSRLPDFAL